MDIHYLEDKNKHIRDERIQFYDPTHTYTIDGKRGYTSVTTWNHSFFEKFDSDKIIKKMMQGKNWNENNKYWNMTPDQIKKAWEVNRDEAASAGTKMHYDIECYYNNNDVVNDSAEFNYFKNFTKDFPELNSKPYRTEWTIFHEELKLAGSVDMIFEDPETNGETLCIYDWKRSKEIVKTNGFNKYGALECIEHLPDTNYWHYCLQLNTYKAIIEAKYNKKVSSMYLVCLHPNNKNNNYIRIKVADLTNEIKDLFDLRRENMIVI